jgi:hypothetical protein
VRADREDVDALPRGLGGDHELRAVRGEGDLPDGRSRLVQTEVAVPGGDLHQSLAGPHEALYGTAAERVGDVDPVAVERDADRETPAAGDLLDPPEVGAVHGEDGHGVAARVHGVEELVVAVVGERALRGQVVGDGAGQYAALAPGGVDALLGEGAVGGALVGDHGVRRRVVALHEHR